MNGIWKFPILESKKIQCAKYRDACPRILANLAGMRPPTGPDFGKRSRIWILFRISLNIFIGRWRHAKMENRSKLINPRAAACCHGPFRNGALRTTSSGRGCHLVRTGRRPTGMSLRPRHWRGTLSESCQCCGRHALAAGPPGRAGPGAVMVAATVTSMCPGADRRPSRSAARRPDATRRPALSRMTESP